MMIDRCNVQSRHWHRVSIEGPDPKHMNCCVNFNSPSGSYYSGQEVSGTIQLYNEKPRNIRALLLQIEGFCETRWTESTGTGKNKKTRTYSGREDYMSTTTFLVSNEGELPAGHHTFNFCFTLPPTIPSSFTNFKGKIRYQVRVEMERKLKFNRSFEFPFTVMGQLNLNYQGSELRQPLKGEISKKFFLGFGSSALTITAELPQRAYVAGQTLSVSVTIVNDSSVNVDETLVELHRNLLFKCSNSISTKRESDLLVAGRHGGVAVKGKSEMTFSLEIPPVEPTNVSVCKFIHITFELAVTAKVSGLHRSPVLSMPITIGTVALIGSEKPSSSSVPYGFALDSSPEKVELALDSSKEKVEFGGFALDSKNSKVELDEQTKS